MMNGGMPASGGGGHMGQMGGQMGMNPMVMGRMPMGPDQVCAEGRRVKMMKILEKNLNISKKHFYVWLSSKSKIQQSAMEISVNKLLSRVYVACG